MTARHSWGPPDRTQHETTRVCRHCGLVRLTRHEAAIPWTEWWRGSTRIHVSQGTPPCERAEAAA